MMKKILAAVLLSAAVTTPALAGNSPIYGGISLGSSSLPNTSSATTVGFLVGYKLDKSKADFMADKGSLSIEGHYTMLGSDTVTFGAGANTLNGTYKYSSLGVDVVALFPISAVPQLSAFGKLGLASNSTTVTCSGTGIYAGSACTATGSSSGLTFGAGVQYDVTSDIGVRAGYQRYASDASAIYAAALYNF